MLNKVLSIGQSPKNNPWIVLPGSRAELIHYKMKLNPPLAEEINKNYGLIKFRHIRRLADQGGLTHTNLQERLDLDPFTSESPQLHLI
jgi:hypothetical protein